MATLNEIAVAQTEFFSKLSTTVNNLEKGVSTTLNQVEALTNRTYGYNHSAVVTENLESLYSIITDSYPELNTVSAVGFTAILQSGDILKIGSNRMFINGTEETTDYAFKGENSENGIEIVNVWYFRDTSNGTAPIKLAESVDFAILNIIFVFGNGDTFAPTNISNKSYVNPSYYEYAQTVTSVGGFLPNVPYGCKSQSFEGISSNNGAQLNVPSSAKNISFDFDSITFSENNANCISGAGKALERLTFPKMTSLNFSNSYIILIRNVPNCVIEMPKIEEIDYTVNSNEGFAVFGQYQSEPVYKVILPETLKKTTGTLFNKGVANVELNCKNAESLSDNMFAKGTTNANHKFSGNVTFCDDWGASINISSATANWSKDDFVKLFHKLRPFETPSARALTIPTAILDALSDDEFAIAEDKNWDINGG